MRLVPPPAPASTDVTGWQQLGEVGVDTGQVWIGDPCYVIGEDAPHGFKSWGAFCDKKDEPEPAGELNGLALRSGHGDGIYPVFGKYRYGVLAEVKVVFIGEPEPEEDGGAV